MEKVRPVANKYEQNVPSHARNWLKQLGVIQISV